MAWADPRPVFDPDAQLDINLDDIFSLKETHHHVVTKDLDYDGLQTALKWVVAKLKAVGGAAAAEPDGRMSKLEEELARLLGENSNLKDRLQTLEKQQAPPPPPAALTTEPPDLSAIYTSLQELEDRVKDLERHPPWVPQAVGVLRDQPPAPAAAPAGDSPAPAPGVNPMLERRIADLEHSVEDLMGSMQDLVDAQGAYSTGALSTGQQQADGGDAAAAAAAAVAPLQQQQQDRAREAKKEREAIKEEMQGLSGQLEHHGGTLEQHGSELEHLQAQLAALRKRLDDKADRSELDSMLQSGANFATSADEAAGTDANGGAGTEDAAAAAPLVKTADGSPFDPEALIEAVNRSNAEVRAVKNRMGVLQERIKNKADQSGVDELRADLDESSTRWKAGMKDLMARRRVEDLEPDIQEISKRVDMVEREQRRLARDKERKKERKERERAEAEAALPALRLPSEAAAEEGGEATAAPPAPELLQTSDLGAQIKELYSQLGNKANAVDVTSIIMHMRDMAAKIKDLQERPLAAGPAEEATQTSRAYSEPASPSWEDGRLERFEAALANLQDSLLCKADVDLVAGKADQDQLDAIGSKLMGMYMDLATKADRAAVDELKLRVAMLGDKAGGVGAVGPDGLPADLSGVNTDGLVQMLQGMMARKAGQEDLDALRELLDSKAGRNEVEALSTRLAAMPLVAAPSSLHAASAPLADKQGGLNSSAFASKDELSTLATQIGDLYAELERQRRELSRVPKDAPLMAMLADQSGLPLSPTQRAAAANRTVGAAAAARAQMP